MYDDVTHRNNFYEFDTDKTDPAKNSKNFNTSNWTVSVEGEVGKPKDFADWREIPSEALEQKELRKALIRALDSLPEKYRTHIDLARRAAPQHHRDCPSARPLRSERQN